MTQVIHLRTNDSCDTAICSYKRRNHDSTIFLSLNYIMGHSNILQHTDALAVCPTCSDLEPRLALAYLLSTPL